MATVDHHHLSPPTQYKLQFNLADSKNLTPSKVTVSQDMMATKTRAEYQAGLDYHDKLHCGKKS